MFLAELYLPSTDADTRRSTIRTTERAAASVAGRGARVNLVHSIFIPEDEMCLLLFEADSAETMARVGETGGLAFDRIVQVISEPPRASSGAWPSCP